MHEEFIITGSFLYKDDYDRVMERGTRKNQYNRLACAKCNYRIKYKATSQRLFERAKNTQGRDTILDTQHYVRVIFVFCPKCDSVPPLPIPGAMIYRNQLIEVPDWNGGEKDAV